MASPFLALLLLFLLLAVGGTHGSVSNAAFLVVHKTATLAKIKKSASESVTVSIVLHNVGSSSAYDVSLNDDTWPSDKFTVVSGNISASWDKLEGDKSLTHTFVLEPKEKGVFQGAPAVVKYRVAAKSALQEVHSTPLAALDLFAETTPEEKYDWLKKLAVKYGPHATVLSIVGLFIFVLVSPSRGKPSKSKKRK